MGHILQPFLDPLLTSTNQAIGSIAIEIITLAEFARINFICIIPFPANTLSADTFPIVTADF